jgi:hypothetical protein
MGSLTKYEFLNSIRRQAIALREGGVDYYFFLGFTAPELLEEIIGCKDIHVPTKSLPVVFTLPIEHISKVHPLTIRIQETGKTIYAAGVTLDFDELGDNLERIRELSVQLGNIPLIVMLEGNYRYADNGREIVPTLDVVQIQAAIGKLKGCEVSIVGFTHGVTLKLVQELSRHQVPLPEAT